MKQVEIEHIPDTEVVYIRRVGQYGAENNALAVFWASFPADMAKSEYKMDFSRPIMERYSIVMVKNGYCEMCVPIL